MPGNRIALTAAILPAFLLAAKLYDLGGRVTGLDPGLRAAIKVLGPSPHQTNTNADGEWVLRNLPPGVYRITPVEPGYRFAPEYRTVTLRARDVINMNFVARRVEGPAVTSKFEITGRVAGLAAGHRATIRAAGPRSYTTTSRLDGTYSFPSVVSGEYDIHPTHSRYSFAPEFHHVDAKVRDAHNINFAARPKPLPPGRR
jgi:hypothetical protein